MKAKPKLNKKTLFVFKRYIKDQNRNDSTDPTTNNTIITTTIAVTYI